MLRGDVGRAPFETFDPGARRVVDDGAAPCLSIKGISCFMHRKTPRRSMSMIRSHSSSVTSAAGLMVYSIPALLNAKSSRPNFSMVALRARCMSSVRVTSQWTASACRRVPRPCAVSLLPFSETSATTTLAPSRAKARAAARPMPFAARSRMRPCQRTFRVHFRFSKTSFATGSAEKTLGHPA